MATILSLSHVRPLPPHLHLIYGKSLPTSYGKSVPTISLHHRVLPRVITTRGQSTRFRIRSDIKVEEGLEGLEGFADETSKLRKQFHELLHTRRSSQVPLKVEPAKPTRKFKRDYFTEAMETCPKADIPNLKDLLVEENFYLYTEGADQGKLPVLIVSMKQTKKTKRPAVVFLHGTTLYKEWMLPLLEAYASRGYVAISVDARYHGERDRPTTYDDALVSSWKNRDTLPFIFDTVWDLMKLADYLTDQRDDIDPERIGITGISLGGMHAWYAAFADTRYSVVVPIIGVQGYRWAIDNNQWQARVYSIVAVFEEARIDMGKSEIDAEVVEKVWDGIAPGLASHFDSPYTIPAIAPRPLLIINGGDDDRNPVPGLDVPKARAEEAYKAHNASEKFKLIVQPGIAHLLTPLMVKETSDWFDRFL